MRLDLDNPKTAEDLADLDVDVLTRIKWGSPVDVCMDCYEQNRFDDDVAHPPYDETAMPYKCAVCGEVLTTEDEGNIGR